jgi:enolase-phosphatase E1
VTTRPDTTGVRAFLLDVEGTTTPISFVHDVLFPYARREMAGFLGARRSDPAVRDALAQLREEGRLQDGIEPALEYVGELMDADRKSTALKALQGLVWERGFTQGELRGRMYPDVAPALRRWRRQGRSTFIYSSGSVLAQRLVFAHSDAGDLSPLLSGYFDTTTGPKKEAGSYRRIAETIGLAPGDVLFVSDSADEIAAARAAGMGAAWCARDAPQGAPRDAIQSFDALAPGE